MRLVVLLLLAAAVHAQPVALEGRTPRLNPDAPATAYVGGRWYDGERFADRDTTWAEGGVFVDGPLRDARIVDLGGRYVVPPFADAHVHRVEGEWAVDWVIADHLEAGTFYVKNLNNIARYARRLAPYVNHPGGIDVAFAHGGITAPGAHPFPLYARLADGVYRDLDPDSLDGIAAWGVATIEDLERRWPDIIAERPDHVKLLLLDHESGQGLQPDVFRRAVALAREAGLQTSVHVDTVADLALAVDAGANEAAHMPPMFGADDRFVISPALAAHMAARDFVVTPTASVAQARDFGGKEAGQAQRAENVRRLLDAGVFVATGTDGSATSAIGEAETLVEIGAMTQAQALYSLTQTGPRSVFPGRAIGVLEDGYEASFLALECDPLANLGCARQIEQRIKQGTDLEVAPTVTEAE
ncbi:amidohydrolase family protein [Rubrivirga sp.]|uniref:amidohydrolase family protein n=1 Tax=Rubrivirga sp. TaxID=1885344 RepID=UPI003C734335